MAKCSDAPFVIEPLAPAIEDDKLSLAADESGARATPFGVIRLGGLSIPATYAWMLALAFMLLGLVARIMAYPISHDEQIYVAPGVLFSWSGLYQDFGFNHLPNFPLLLHFAYAATGTSYFLLVGRCITVLSWIATIGVFYLIARRYGRSLEITVLAIVLLLTNNSFLGPPGMLVTNNLIPVPLALFGLYLFFREFDGPGPRPLGIAASGFFLALAIGFKSNYVFVLPAIALALLICPMKTGFGGRLRRLVLPMFAGGLIGGAPTLIFLLDDPNALFAHAVRYFTEAHLSYWMTVQEPKIVSGTAKIALAQSEWFSGSSAMMVLAVLYLALRQAAFDSDRAAWRRILSWRVLVLATMVLCGGIVSFIPTPSFSQYFTPPIAFVIFLVVILYGQYNASSRAQLNPFITAAVLISVLTGGSRIVPEIPKLISFNQWTGIQTHRLAQSIAEVTSGKALTLSPIYALEAGLQIYPEFATGPFLYRVADFISPEDRKFYRLVSERNLASFLDSDPPDAIIVGQEAQLDQALIAYAQSRSYAEAPLPPRDAMTRYGRVTLYVRPANLSPVALGQDQAPIGSR